jgi:hypothetical protein
MAKVSGVAMLLNNQGARSPATSGDPCPCSKSRKVHGVVAAWRYDQLGPRDAYELRIVTYLRLVRSFK